MTAIQSFYDCGAVLAERLDNFEDWQRRLGTITGTPKYGSGSMGRCFKGAGVWDFSKKNKTNYTAKSVVMWLTPAAYTGASRIFFINGYYTGGYGDLIYAHSSSNVLYVALKNSAGTGAISGPDATFTPGEPMCFGYSWNGTTATYYKNGIALSGPDALSGTLSCASESTVGRSTTLSPIDKLHAIAVFDRALTATEMLDLAKGQPFDRISRSLVSEWRPGAGPTIPDLGWKGLGNNGTATNATALKTPFGWGAAFANGGISWSTISFTGYEYIYAAVGGQYHHYYYDGTNTYTDGIATGSMPLAITSTGFSGATCNMAYLAVRDAALTPLQVRHRYNSIMAGRF